MRSLRKRKAKSVERRAESGESRHDTRSSLPAPRALTLVELLVVLVILVTLVGGVLPVLSPNNDARKIDAASRSLKTYFLKAQTRAARIGRPVGVAFRESSVGSGVALEVYQVEVPRPFSGFSSASTAIFWDPPPHDNDFVYVIQFGTGFGDKFQAAQQNDPQIPPRMVRVDDVIEVGNSRFKLGWRKREEIDVALQRETGEFYFNATSQFNAAKLVAGPAPPTVPVDASNVSLPLSYAIARQPIPTSEAPMVLPSGVAIDMHASGIDGGSSSTLLAADDGGNLKQLSLMFSPQGGIHSIYYNGRRYGLDEVTNRFYYASSNEDGLGGRPITDATRFVFLLARVEQSGLPIAGAGFDPESQSSVAQWNVRGNDADEQMEDARENVSWLNLDSRWVSVHARSGRSSILENQMIDPRTWKTDWETTGEFAFKQIRKARGAGSVRFSAIEPTTQP